MLHPGSEIHVGEKSESDIWDMGNTESDIWDMGKHPRSATLIFQKVPIQYIWQ
jgi:hypothetical protein